MINLFNRAELKATFDMAEQARIRALLASNGIEYTVKTVDRKSAGSFSSASRGRSGSFGENQQLMLEYIIYVKKADLQKAKGIIKE
ncbi:MAG: hypothetical protein II995_08065 [Oscillospiraceae bacterium]|nr:hypothetical protein [Oscillospiraceae bacterium]